MTASRPRRVAITGIGCVSAAGAGVESLSEALREGRPLGSTETLETVRGGSRAMRLARLAPFERETFLPPRQARRMGEMSQVWVISCLLARADAGLVASGSDPWPPERRATYLGTGFGCTQTTWDYLLGMARDGAGMANPFLFSESVANAPAGHSSIAFDTRGAGLTVTCGDASSAAAVSLAARAIRDDRVDMAYCGGVETFSPPLLRVLAALGAPPFLGEGAACLILEEMSSALARGARVYAQVASDASASDPSARSTDWSRDPETFAAAMSKALRRAEHGGNASPSSRAAAVHLHACGAAASDDAERAAATRVCPGSPARETTSIVGAFAAAGGLNLAAAALDVAARGRPRTPAESSPTLLAASSWGGSVYCLSLLPPP